MKLQQTITEVSSSNRFHEARVPGKAGQEGECAGNLSVNKLFTGGIRESDICDPAENSRIVSGLSRSLSWLEMPGQAGFFGVLSALEFLFLQR